MTSDEILEKIFQPAIDMYIGLFIGGFSNDWEDRFEQYNGEHRSIYTHVTDSRYPSKAAVGAAARELFSEELAQYYLNLTLEDMIVEENEYYNEAQREVFRQLPILTEKDGKLYTLDRSRGGYLAIETIRVESQSENKTVYVLHAVSLWEPSEGDPVSEDYTYTRELIGGKWVFTTFPMDWL